MASVRKRNDGGVFYARWRDADGKLVEESTWEYNPEAALTKANRMEAVARFWEDVPNFQAYAAMNYSPKYCHESFIAAKHLRFDRFCSMLAEAGVQFAPESSWRDSKKKTSTRAKKYKYNGKLLTPMQLIEQTGTRVRLSTLKDRLAKGWDVQKALESPPIQPHVSGGMAAG